MYDGDFGKWVDASGTLIPIYDPATTAADASSRTGFTRQIFSGNQIPKSRFDSLAVKALAAFQQSGVLVPNRAVTPGTSQYVRSNYLITQGSNTEPVDKFSVKGDHIFSEKDRLSGMYLRTRTYVNPGPQGGKGVLPGLYANYNNTQRHSDVFRMSWDHTFSPTLLNHFYAGGNDWRENHDPPQSTALGGYHWKDKVCLVGVVDCDQNLLQLNFSEGYTTWSGVANNGSENTIYSFNDDLTWIKSKHTFKAGGMYQRNHYNGFGRQCIAGCTTYTSKETGFPGDPNFTTGGGNPFASFLLGYVDSGQVDTLRFIGQEWPYFAGYFQDDWRVSTKLTLNLGIRWETTLPPVEAKDRWVDFSPTTPNPAANNILGAMLYAGTGPGRVGTRSLADSWFGGWGPHIGVAYSLNSKTVIRSSYARSFAVTTTVTGSTHNTGFSTIPVFTSTDNGVTPAFLLSDRFPPFPLPPFINPSVANGQSPAWFQGREATRMPENNSWDFSIERQLTNSTVLDVAYNGQAGSHLQSALLNYNQVNPIYLTALGPAILNSNINSAAATAAGIQKPYPTFTGSVAQALRPFPQFSGIDTWSGAGDHSGHSAYHSAIIKLEKRYAGGLTFQSSYVLSKLLTDSDSYWVTDYGFRAEDQYNRRLEKSIGTFDVTHNFKLGLVYDVPFGKGRKWLTSGPGSWVVGGWRFSSIHYYATGTPVGLDSGVDLPISPNVTARRAATITTYDNWRGPTTGGRFDPNPAAGGTGDRFLEPRSFFPPQPTNAFGNSTRFNPKLRLFPNYNENMALAKSFVIREQMRVDFRWEGFNVFNRTRFGTGPTKLSDPNLGLLTSNSDLLNTPRTMQFGLKFYW
jgi:hypothetical protein